MRDRARKLDFALARRFGLATREDRIFYLLIGAVGILVGFGGLAIGALTDLLQKQLWGGGENLLEAASRAPWWIRVGAPTVGGLMVGMIVYAARMRLVGHGTSSLLEAVALKGGRIEAKPVLLAVAAGVATVGSGGSLGREGPMVSLGAMSASWFGARLGLSPQRVKILVGCGAAAGVAALYNTPIGGALFAMEVILGNFALEIFGPIVVSSVLSTLVVRSFHGNAPIYAIPGYQLESGWELLFYVGLGILGALASVLFIGATRGAERLFRAMRFVPTPLRPAIGMALVGVLGLYVPYVFGNGFETITLALHGDLPFLLLLALPLAKLAATALTHGSGAVGGMFTPSLFVGSLVGGAYGTWIHQQWPTLTAESGAYAAIGMAALAAGTSHAPISAILILFEFTGNYDLILPLMLAAITSSLLARKLHPGSIYTESLRRKGIDVSLRMEEVALASLKASDLARPDRDVLRPSDDYKKVVDCFLSAHRQRLFVVDAGGRLLGAISLHDIKHALEDPETLTAVVAHDLMIPAEALEADERLHRATEVFAASDFERLPVIADDGRFVGVLAKRDLLAVYAQEVVGRPALLAKLATSREDQGERGVLELPPDFSLRMVPLPESLVGKTLAEARLPQVWGVRILEIQRPREGREPERLLDAGGDTRFEQGDQIILLGPTAAVEALAGEAREPEA